MSFFSGNLAVFGSLINNSEIPAQNFRNPEFLNSVLRVHTKGVMQQHAS